MIEVIFELIRFGFSLILCMAVSILFVGIKSTWKNNLSIISLFIVFLFIWSVCRWFFDPDMMKRLYPLLIHLPLILIITFYYKRPWLRSVVSVLSAYMCCQAPNWIEIISQSLFNSKLADLTLYIAAVFLLYYILKKYVAVSVRHLIEKSNKSCIFIGVIPLFYYLFDYITAVCTDTLYSGAEWAVEFMPSVISILYFIFIILYYIEMQKQAILQREADFAQNIISSSRGHYQKMNELYEAIRIMRHDYKFHLNAAIDMLHRGEIEKSDDYLSGLKRELAEKEMPDFCDNPVINSLIADYARRCSAKTVSNESSPEIKMDVSINIPKNFSVPNYEMCIVLGNLLENAIEACQKLETKSERKIELVVKPQGEITGAQLAIMVRNTFNGKVLKNGEQFISTKKNGDIKRYGIGLQSVKAVVERYGGIFYTEYDDKWFNTYVFLGGGN